MPVQSIVALVDGVDAQDAVLGLEGGPRPGWSVTFQVDEVPALNLAESGDVDAEALETLRRLRRPAYVEFDPGTRLITQVLLPTVARVVTMRRLTTADFEIGLDASAASRLVGANVPRRLEIMNLLRDSRDHGTLLVITDEPDTHAIIDVRAAGPGITAPALQWLKPPDGRCVIDRISTMTRQRADTFIHRMAHESCRFPGPAEGCTPFRYPDDGCWGRAQRMCDLLLEEGVRAGKLWVFGRLPIRTPNHPHCRFTWQFHVAPIVKEPVPGSGHWRVLDPSLFEDRSVSSDEWKDAVHGHDAESEITDASVFLQRTKGNARRQAPDETADCLAFFAAELKKRVKRMREAPPFARCRI